jgi:hypothetical protein
LDLNPHHLEATLADILTDTLSTEDDVLSLALGAQYYAKYAGQWTTDVNKALSDFASRSLFNEGPKNKLQFLAAIVLSGEADAASIAALKTALDIVLPDHKRIIHDTVAHEYVGAIGAAYWSKLQVDQPDVFYVSHEFQHIPDEL